MHLVYKYRSSSEEHSVYNGLRIEIQIRSRLQHYWATAVEVVDTVAHEGIKVGRGNQIWRRFFALMACAMAREERRNLVPDTPDNPEELRAEIAALASELRVDPRLRGYATSIRSDTILQGSRAFRVFLLTLNLETRRIQIQGFDDVPAANAALFAKEKENAGNPNLNSVLVGLEKLRNLRPAYPNYYLDTNEFLRFLAKAVAKDNTAGGRKANGTGRRSH